MQLLAPLLALVALVTTACAIHEADVGVVDWHKHLVGVPLITAPVTAPSFHSTGNDTVILTATASNVLAALNPEDGAVLWRFIYEPEDGILGYYKSSKTVATLSGLGGSTLRLFNISTGGLVIERQLHHPTQGSFSDPPYFGKQVVFSEDASTLYVLSNGYTVTSVNASSGDINWSWTAPDQGSLVLYNKLALTGNTIYVLGFGASIASYTLHATVLSPTTGALVISLPLDAKITDPLTGFVVLTRPDLQRPIPVWLDGGIMRYLVLSPELREKTRVVAGEGYEEVRDVGMGGEGACVVGRADGTSFVMKFEGGVNSVQGLGEIGGTINSDELADSLYAGGYDADGNSYVTRVYWSHKDEIAYSDVFDAKVSKSLDFTFAFDTKTHGVIAHVTLDPTPRPHPRILITTSTGAIQLWHIPSSSSSLHPQALPKWTREESLASTALAEFVDLPERAALFSLAHHADEGYFGRLARHVVEMRGLPGYVVGFVRRFVGGGYATTTSVASSSSSSSTTGDESLVQDGSTDLPLSSSSSSSSSSTTMKTTTTKKPKLTRDTFGFRQIIVVATHFGKVYGLDSTSGEVVWGRVLGLGWAGQLGGRVQPVKMFVTRRVGDVGVGVGAGGKGGEGGEGDPEVVIVAQRRADNSLVDTVVFHINAVTGEDATGASMQEGVLEGHDAIQGPLVEAYLLNAEEKIVVMLDEFLQVFLYPENERTLEIFRQNAAKLSFPLKTTIENRSRVVGHQVIPPMPPASDSTSKPNDPKADFNIDPNADLNANPNADPNADLNIDPNANDPNTSSKPPSYTPRAVAHPTWTLTLPPSEHVQSLVPPTIRGPVASLGKVLGDRRTLYKYLSPRMGVVLSVRRGGGGGEQGSGANDAKVDAKVDTGANDVKGSGANDVKVDADATGNANTKTKCGIRVIDTTTGSVHYHVEVEGTREGRCDVKVALVENWLVYHYYDADGGSVKDGGSAKGGAKGYRVVSVEFYEGAEDEKVKISDMTAYSNDTLHLKTYEESFVFPYGVTALGATATKYGISSRNLIVATNNHRIQSFPRSFLDPRRPHRKPTNEEMEEGLMQYDPLVIDDQRRILSHRYDVANVQRIITAPSILESTSLVFAHGLDMFLTRVAPSSTFDVLSENFNKAQLVFTVIGLAVGIVVVGPMVARKKLRGGWYQS